MMQIVCKDIRSIVEIPLKKPDCIEDKRWEKIQKMKAESDKKRSLASGYLLDYMCQELQVTDPVYEYAEKGKPVLKSVECAFNISHSENYVVLAYHKMKEPVGVDIQKVRPMREGMERRILHEKEKEFLLASEETRERYLNRLWAVKESFVKMTGEGLLRDFRTIHADFVKGAIISDDGKKAQFIVCECKEEYYLSICAKNVKDLSMKEI